METNYNYNQVFRQAMLNLIGRSPDPVKLTGDALVFLKRWKDSRQFEQGFETLSAECAGVLGIEQDLGKRDFRDLVELDYFRLIDQKIISDLVRAVVGRTVTSGDVALWVRQRRQGHWYGEFRHLYEAIEFAARFVQKLGESRLTMDSLSDGVQRYSRSWYQLDQLYRKFTYHVRMSGQASLMGELSEQVGCSEAAKLRWSSTGSEAVHVRRLLVTRAR